MNDPTTKGLLNGNNTEKRRGDESPGFVGAVHTSGYPTDVEIQPTSEKPMYRPTGLSKREMLMIAGLFLLLVLCILFIALYAKVALKKSDRKSEDEKNESIGWILAASDLLSAMNASADPCDDFYQYACGKWIKRSSIPDSRPSWSQFGVLDQNNEIIMKRLIFDDEDSARAQYKDNEAVMKGFDLFDSCMDEDKIEELGAEPLFDLIREYGSWNVTDGNWTEDSWNFMDNFVKIQKYLSIAPLFSMYVNADLKDSAKNIIYFNQGGISISQESYLKNSSRDIKVRAAYKKFMIDLVKLLTDNPNAKALMTEIYNFEESLAKAFVAREKRQDIHKSYKKMKLSDFNKSAGTAIDMMDLVRRMFNETGYTITAPFQVTAILAVPGPFENPRIPGYLISRSQGEELLKRLDGGEEIQILCSWSAVDVWFNLPEHSLELNDSIILHNYGDEDMPWVVDMIDNNASFETDPFYSARVFGPDHATTFNGTEMKNITVFNSSALDDDFHLLKLPFRFPHYLQFKDKVFVSANGVLVFDPVFSNIVGSIADSVAPTALIAPLWADLFGGAITGQGDSRRLVLRFEGFWLKPTGLLTEPSGPFTFDVWLFDDGEIHIHWETFPHSGWLELVEIGLEPGSGAKALPLKEWGLQVDTQNTPNETQSTPNLTDFTDPFRSRSLSAVLVPWVKLSRSTDALPPNQFLTVNMTLPKTPSETTAWLFFYARKSLGTWHPRRNVRLLQRTFRHVWVLSGWDGGLHSGSCAANGLVRRRTRRCVGSDGAEYDESYCIGSCEDITLEQNFDYPVRHVWKDGYNNRCEDYRALSFCNETGYGPKWQSWWGRFEDWVSGGPGAGEACCLCGGGRVSEPSGASGASGAPVLSEKCPSVKCPVNSVGVDVLSGCSCQAGFEGEVIPSDQSPYFRGQCSPVACPLHSFGEHVADGCVCDAGYIGSIIPSKAEPFFIGSCREASTSASSSVTATRTGTRTSTASTSTTSLHSLHEFTTGIPYTSARHETVSSTTSSISTSTESTARTMYMGTFPERRSVQVSATATTTSESPLSTIDFWTSTSFASFASFTFTSSSSSSTDSMANSPTSESQTSTEANLPFPALDNSTQTKSSTGTTTTRTITVGNRSTSSTPTTITALSPEDSEYRQTHPQSSSTSTAQSAQSTQSQTSTLTFPTAGFSSAFTTSTSSTSTTFQTFTTSKVETMELVNEAGANVELSGAYEPPKAAFASTSRKVAAMVTQGSDGGPSTSALILLLLISTPCFACLCGAGRHLLARKAKSAAVHPEPPEPSEPNPASEPSEPSEPHVRIVRIVRPDWDAPDAPDAPGRHCAPVTVRAAVHAEKKRSDHVEISDM